MSVLHVRNAVRRLSDDQRSFALAVHALTIGPGDRKAIVGPSGSGKTTAMDLIALASTPDACDVHGIQEEDGRWIDLAHEKPEALARIRASVFGYVLQTASLLPFLSIGDNIRLPQRLSSRMDEELIKELLQSLDVRVPLATMPAALSTGQRQRVSIARALAHRPAFVLADEPTAALDPVNAQRAMHLLVSLAAQQGAGVLVITHDRPLVETHGFEIIPVRFSADDTVFSSIVDDGSGGADEARN
jgi:putative ABC transport system ATP-binding protein